MISAPHCCTPAPRRGTDRRGKWVNRPHRSSRLRRGGADQRNLTDSEVSGQAKVTQMTTLTPRTRWCTCGGQWSSGGWSPPCMVERRRGWSPAGHFRPRDGHGKGARALGSRGEQDARKEKREGEAERRGPWSGNLRRAQPCSSEQCPSKGPYHGKLMRAWAARGRGGAQSEVQLLVVS
jgi:hypothetical protein